MSKAETDLGKAIAKNHYVELKSKAREAAAVKLTKQGLVRIYEKDGGMWAKALTRDAYNEMASW